MNQELKDLIEKYGFKTSLKNKNLHVCEINNDTACQFKLRLHLLNDNETVRISILEEDTNGFELFEGIELFETKDINKIIQFIEMVI